MQLTIGKCELQKLESGKVRISSKITLGKKNWELFYEVDDTYESFLCTERADSFLLPVLPMAMMAVRKHPDLEICAEDPVSERLYHQLVNYYIPILCRNISYYSPVKLQVKTCDELLPCACAVGTGISGGVDSSYTIAKYTKGAGYRLTHGVYFNAGIYDGYESPSEKSLEKKAQEIAKDAGIEYICVKTNTCKDLYGGAHAPIVPFIFMGAVLGLQKLFSIYYYSSAFSAEEAHFADEDAAYYEWLNVASFSTQNTTFYSSGIEVKRLEKIRYIKDIAFVQKHLTVCLNAKQENGNCGRCAKCTRTMAELETVDALDKFSNVFDVKTFRENPEYHWGYIILKSWSGDSFCNDIIKKYKQSGHGLPTSAYIGALKKWAKRGFTTTNKARVKVEEVMDREIREL